MRLLPSLGLGVVSVAFLASSAQAEDYSPFLEGLRNRVQYLIDARSSVTLPDPELAALERAMAALDRPSASMAGDLAKFSRVVVALESRSRLREGSFESVQTAIYLFWHRLESRRFELLERLHDEDIIDSMPPGGLSRAYQRLRFTRQKLERDRFRKGTWRSSVRLLARAAADLDVAAAAMGVDRNCSFVEGSVTATIGGWPRTWTIACATVQEQGGIPSDPRQGLRLFAFSEDRHSSVYMDPLLFSGPGEKMGGLVNFVEYPNHAVLFPIGAALLQPQPEDGPYEITLDAIDVAAGTASGTFDLHMVTSDFHASVEVIGQFTITSGLERR